MPVKIYHNPRCGKSRDTLKLLQAKGIVPEIIEYLKTPPSTKELADILKKLGIPVRDLIRKKEPEYLQNKLDNLNLSEDELITILVNNPKLIERPIVLANDKAAIGRPPEAVESIL